MLIISKKRVRLNIITIVVMAFLLAATGLVYLFKVTNAADTSNFNAGNIISDAIFYNSSSMSVDEIQSFLNTKVTNCDTNHAGFTGDSGTTYNPPWICLKDYYENPDSTYNVSYNYIDKSGITRTDSRTYYYNNAYKYTALTPVYVNGSYTQGVDHLKATIVSVGGTKPSGSLSAARIIYNVAQQYGINPKVLIVLLQKEQGLVTDTWPSSWQYQAATGYGCPDYSPCSVNYAGFSKQLASAAWQFKQYQLNPTVYSYTANRNNTILWNPSSTCGSSTVFIQNQATAGLYNYTPYRPNQAALDAGYGIGNSCSSYGNRNFWLYFTDWFGSTQASETLIKYKAHVGNVGWQNFVINSNTMGTTGQSKSMEAFKINGSVEYSSYNNTTGWQPTVSNGMVSGTTGMSRAIQAIKINPTGTLANNFDIYYRVHLSNIGWVGWTKNGSAAGITGSNTNNIEAIEIRLVVKGGDAPGSTDNAYQNIQTTTYSPDLSLSVASHVGDVGWQTNVIDTMVSGTTEETKRIEALKISLVNNTGLSGSVLYSSHLADIGWQNFVSNGAISGTTGQSRRMEAIRLTLTGAISDKYDLWYRGYVQNIGWMGWTKNGNAAGSVGASLQLEAVETRIVKKDTSSPAASTSLYNPFKLTVPATYRMSYSTHISNVGWIGSVTQGNISGTTGQSKTLEAIRIDSLSSSLGNLSINCSVYVKGAGWTDSVGVGNTCGTTGQSKVIEAVKLSLNGDVANKYDIYYKVHSSYIGWQDWVKNGDQAGVVSQNKPLEAIIIKLVQK